MIFGPCHTNVFVAWLAKDFIGVTDLPCDHTEYARVFRFGEFDAVEATGLDDGFRLPGRWVVRFRAHSPSVAFVARQAVGSTGSTGDSVQEPCSLVEPALADRLVVCPFGGGE